MKIIFIRVGVYREPPGRSDSDSTLELGFGSFTLFHSLQCLLDCLLVFTAAVTVRLPVFKATAELGREG